MTLDILIAEDDVDVQKLYEFMFKMRDVNAVIKGNLKDAVEAAKAKKFDLYITDGTYPADKDSPLKRDICYDFYDKVKEINPEAKIVVVSAMNYYVPSDRAPDMTNLPKSNFNYRIDELLKSVEVKK